MKRWLSLIKRHVTPGTWTRPAKKRRPITVVPDYGAHSIFHVPVDAGPFSRRYSTASLNAAPTDIFSRPVEAPPIGTPSTPVEIVAPKPRVSLKHLTTAPLRPRRPASPPHPPLYPLCDTDLILSRYYYTPSPEPGRIRPDSATLPAEDVVNPREAFASHRFIHFEPTYTVTVSEVAPYQIKLIKPRPARLSARFSATMREYLYGKV